MQPTMTKSELIEAVAERTRLAKAKAEILVNCIFDVMVEALARGEGIELRGFGSFSVREYKPYEGRNPRTGAPVHVKPKRLPFFKVGKELKERVQAAVAASIASASASAPRPVPAAPAPAPRPRASSEPGL